MAEATDGLMRIQRWANRFLRIVIWLFGPDAHDWPLGSARWAYRLARICAWWEDKLRADAQMFIDLWRQR